MTLRNTKICINCKQEQDIEQFIPRWDSPKTKRRGDCNTCRKDRTARNFQKRYATQEGKDKQKANEKRHMLASPRAALRHAINNGIKRKPTTNPITPNEIMEIWNKQGGKCALSGVQMTWGKYNQGHKPIATSVTLDRIDYNKSYEKGNIRLVCYSINSFRGRMSDSEMRDLLKQFYAFQFPMTQGGNELLSENHDVP